ncbi:MAG: putative beta-lysine N-acetyltransferase [Ruminococcus sp.]|nr:putative beta-lysine N-acetyltransferase [Ruminococcus sp.]
MYDTIAKINNSEIQHGFLNKRIYLMHLHKRDVPGILDDLERLADRNKYTKIFGKIPASCWEPFLKRGYIKEAVIPGFFGGNEDCAFMGKYIDKKRSLSVNQDINKEVLEAALKKLKEKNMEDFKLAKEFTFRKTRLEDSGEMSMIYSKVFDSYPFPIFDPEYLKKTMGENIVYFGIWKENRLIALSSCEMDMDGESVEMTDFAVLQDYRGYNFACFLLNQMEREMKLRQIKTAYTIARAESFGMNCTFAKCGYTFSGTLIKNTQIGGKIEDMNVWFKKLI